MIKINKKERGVGILVSSNVPNTAGYSIAVLGTLGDTRIPTPRSFLLVFITIYVIALHLEFSYTASVV